MTSFHKNGRQKKAKSIFDESVTQKSTVKKKSTTSIHRIKEGRSVLPSNQRQAASKTIKLIAARLSTHTEEATRYPDTSVLLSLLISLIHQRTDFELWHLLYHSPTILYMSPILIGRSKSRCFEEHFIH